MKKLSLILIFLSFFISFSFSKEQEKSPMYFEGVDAGMSPQQVIKILGNPTKKERIEEGNLRFIYLLSKGCGYTIDFYKGKWLQKIAIVLPVPIHYTKLGLPTGAESGFKIFMSKGRKIWHKIIFTKKYGQIIIIYQSKQNSLTLIDSMMKSVGTPSKLEK